MLSRILPFLLLAACPPAKTDDTSDSTPDTDTDTDTAVTDGPCDEANARLGQVVCVHSVPDDPTFDQITIASGSATEPQASKYMVPARTDARLPTLFMNVNAYTLHYEFLVTAFPDLFSGLSQTQYFDLILYPDTREYYAGTFSLYLGSTGFFYGFTIWDDPSDPTSTISLADATATWSALQPAFPLGTLSFVPGTEAQIAAASTWGDTPFPIAGLEEVAYEVYNPGEAYGTLRLYTLDELDAATDEASFGYQDIIGIEEAPTDLERVTAGIVTGTRQGALSHLSVRAGARGSPNCYVKDLMTELASWEGKLVRFECGADSYSIAEATVADAEAWWTDFRPDPTTICAPDLDQLEMPGLLEASVSTAEERGTTTCQYGVKGTNLATLYRIVPPEYQLDGFLIPFHYYDDFVHTATWTVDLNDGQGAVLHSFAETMDAWFADETFLTDAALRRDNLDALRHAMEDSPVDPAVIEAIAPRIEAIWGNTSTYVRFRSSSNAEDTAGFSGAGLYDSETGCIGDDLDGDEVGPSQCDPEESDERTVAEAVATVWASLWTIEAWEEDSWYGIDPHTVAMGLLVDTKATAELANIVAFSGNPTSDDDDRYLVNAQAGELDVVLPDPGIWPESDLLTLSDTGELTEILRVESSSEVDAGELVLSDAQLQELGELFWDVVQVYPYDDVVPDDKDLLWDTEWKILSDGQLIIKQIRPYLR